MAWLDQLPQVASAAVMLLLAAALLALNFNHRANRAFALLLALRGLTAGLSAAGFAAGPDGGDYFWRVLPYALLPIPFVALWFGAVYPAPRPWLRRAPWVPGLLLVGAVAVEVAYFLDHALFLDLAGGPFALGPERQAPAGPLFLFSALPDLAYALLGLVFARDAAARPAGPMRSTVLLVSVGFAVVALYDVPVILALAPEFAARHPPALAAGLLAAQAAALLLAAATAALYAQTLARAAEPAERSAARRALLALGLTGLAVGFVLLLTPTTPRLLAGPVLLSAGLVRLALPVLVSYALLRHRIFDIEVKARWTVRQSTLGAAFLGAFFVASEGAQTFFSQQPALGPYLGIVAAGVLVAALAPLQRAADRLATAAIPRGPPLRELPAPERAALYREQVRLAWADGAMSRKEKALLEHLRGRLGLSDEEAVRLEREALA